MRNKLVVIVILFVAVAATVFIIQKQKTPSPTTVTPTPTPADPNGKQAFTKAASLLDLQLPKETGQATVSSVPAAVLAILPPEAKISGEISMQNYEDAKTVSYKFEFTYAGEPTQLQSMLVSSFAKNEWKRKIYATQVGKQYDLIATKSGETIKIIIPLTASSTGASTGSLIYVTTENAAK